MLRALINALAAQAALVRIYVCQIVLKRDGLKRAGLDTLAATYAGNGARLLGNGALILVDAAYIYPAVHLVAVTQFYHVAWTSLDTGSACSTFILIHHRQACLRIHLYGIELTSLNAVTTSQAAPKTACITSVHQGSRSTA